MDNMYTQNFAKDWLDGLDSLIEQALGQTLTEAPAKADSSIEQKMPQRQ